MLIRAKFEELQSLKYISHLELMTVFRRAFRRAGLPLAYSKGFNPHILLSLGQPLKVGMSGREEYFDLGLRDEIEIDKFIKMVNKEFPQGLTILDARVIPENSKSLMATIDTAVYLYKMTFNNDNINEKEMLSEFLSEDEILLLRKRRKKKDREIDIRPLIYDAEVIGAKKWKFRVRCGSVGNLRPEEVSEALGNFFSEVEDIPLINIEREGLFVNIRDKFYSPLDDLVIGR